MQIAANADDDVCVCTRARISIRKSFFLNASRTKSTQEMRAHALHLGGNFNFVPAPFMA
jgi:hypothetical protein